MAGVGVRLGIGARLAGEHALDPPQVLVRRGLRDIVERTALRRGDHGQLVSELQLHRSSAWR